MAAVTSFQEKAQGMRRHRRFKSDRDEIWHDCSSSKCASTDESDFRFNVTISKWRPRRHFTQKSTAAWWAHTQRLSWSIVHACLFVLSHCVVWYLVVVTCNCMVSIVSEACDMSTCPHRSNAPAGALKQLTKLLRRCHPMPPVSPAQLAVCI